ncbi:MAG: primosomal protein N' [Campylobacterales bacterium]|nr:primosomal protein N' [Campylobacterales bacterium]
MHYYQVSLVSSKAPYLTYSYQEKITIGTLIDVPVGSSIKKAIIIEETSKPIDFEALEILSITQQYYSSFQIEIAQFISSYYFSTLSKALSLFVPFSTGSETLVSPKSKVKTSRPSLTPIQQKAYETIQTHPKSLLFGVTGSGKSEVFITLIADTLADGKQAILLMPEINLTPQMGKRLKHYFDDRVAIWHSKLSKKQKENILEAIGNGKVRIVAGARSALFLPLDSIGLIVVDEEHDDSYKSSSSPRYNARDVALLMGDRCQAKVLLVSATPSLNSYYKLPVVRLQESYIQTKKRYIFKTPSHNTIDNTIIKAIQQNYAQGNQSILFIPTRANFKYLTCPSCGQTHKCPFCTVGMALHAKYRLLKCHYCNYTEPITSICKSCGHSPLTSQRIGTVEAIESIQNTIEGITIEQFDKDSINTANKLQKAIERFDSGETHLLVGTQMLSKGHDYANITLGIITGLDYILGIGDYRASQKAVALMQQLSGRCGRAKEATVIIESANSEFFGKYLDNYEAFIHDELEFIKNLYPPFVSLARILINHKEESKAQSIMHETVAKLQSVKNIEIVGYGKNAIERVANRFRYNILLRSKERVALLKALNFIKRNDIDIDMDPVDFS